MTIRNRALGRARQAFAPNTLYIRGDVVSYLNALYAAKETFTSGASFSLADWDAVIPAPIIPQTNLTGLARNTAGAGLPPFSGRSAGDQHFDSTAKKEYILTGTPGQVAADTFEYTTTGESSLIGSTSSSGLVWAGIALKALVNGSQLEQQSTNDGTAGTAAHLPVTMVGEIEGSITFPYQAGFTNSSGNEVGLSIADSTGANRYTFALHDTAQARVQRDGSNLLFAPLGRTPAAGEVITLSFKKTTTAIFLYFNGVQIGTVAHANNTTFARAGIVIGNNFLGTPTKINEFQIYAVGTLAWEDANQTVGTHVHTGRIGDAAVFTIGDGLPSFAGRIKGDGHYNLTDGRFHLLTGDPGAGGVGQSDDFSVGTGGSALSSPWIGVFGTIRYVGNGTAHATAQSGTPGAVYVRECANGDGQVNIRSLSATGANLLLVARSVSTSAMYWVNFGTKTIHKKVSGTDSQIGSWTGNDPGVGGLMSFSFVGSLLTVFINTIQVAQVTDTSITNANTRHGMGFSTNSVPADDWSYGAAQGTFVWSRTDPLYFQGVVGGTISVANHVLKPGIRIPSTCAVRRFVVRFDAALSGGATTVVARRFNNGVDTGDSLTVTVADGQTVGSAVSSGIATAQGDMWKFDVTAAGGSPSHMLLALDAWGS